MREIKFRAIRKEGNRFVFGLISKYEEDYLVRTEKSEQIGIDWLNTIEVIPETIGQYTGLKDKNGVERFEGDIIKRDTGYIFVEEKKIFSLGGKNDAKCYGYDYHLNDEVIGNIHENPELLN